MIPLSRCVLALALSLACAETKTQEPPTGLRVVNGWYVHGDEVIWGYAQHNGWWRPGERPNITRRGREVRPNRTEDLDALTDAMLRFAYPAFEHNFGLWYDRRRDRHDTEQRPNGRVAGPLLEQPWARSNRGTAWDGLPKYDLERYDDWYFRRLEEFADLCDRKGTVLLFNFYMQHALLENNAHYVDFPWRPVNCLQDTGLPDSTPAANVFYDVTHPERRRLHKSYIRKCLDVLGENTNVIFLCSQEYTGPLSFTEFWLDTVYAWEREHGRDVHVALSATKDVIDAVMRDPARAPGISTIDLRYWWYQERGALYAPRGGEEVPGRYAARVTETTPIQIYRQVREYRVRHPKPALIHGQPSDRRHAWAALMGGASLLVGQLPYPRHQDPPEYISPELCRAIQPTYDFVRQHLAKELPKLSPRHDLVDGPFARGDLAAANRPAWCLSDGTERFLVYALAGGSFELDLSAAGGSFEADWFHPATGKTVPVPDGPVDGGRRIEFTAPSADDWVFWARPSKPK